MKLGLFMLIAGVTGILISLVLILWCYLPRKNRSVKREKKIKIQKSSKVAKVPKEINTIVEDIGNDDTMLLDDIENSETELL